LSKKVLIKLTILLPMY